MHHKKKYFFLAIALPIQIFLVQFLSQRSSIIEQYYSNGIYKYISKFFRFILGWVPFSFGDVLGFILIFFFARGLYQLIKNRFKNLLHHTLKFIAILSIVYFCFYAFWGLNYFREPLAENLGLQQSKYSTEELVKTTKQIVSELNKVHLQITKNDTLKIETPYSQKEIYKLAPNGYDNLSKTYPQLIYKIPSIKSSLVSLFQSYNGTAGYINPITGEAQINDMIPKTGYPSTTCHEMAHQIGWAAENDANFVGFLSSIANDDLYFKYSGYRMAYNYCIGQVYKHDKEIAKEIKKSVNKGIYKDYRDSYLHWKQFDNPIEPYLKKGYNSYLKANNQTKGIKSYSYVVDLLIAYYKQDN
ncbi:DUF3810 domain-containing protein [Tenacibaculum sp. S7007]|uniref:DUF3810 domain-containing protein n=1 Tax=Tenacibaculum pelagium TaxID=2759527 RepID=A0A839AII4_9FLAO|nr:DUF3810 domain-containing protein [Tenacibaculum pelagium]MBA6155002.1 DUF3810 domain-containing protein [Tenacibaculum pelagium]